MSFHFHFARFISDAQPQVDSST